VSGVDATTWDERYAASELVWGAGPNRWVAQELADAPPGRALDLACGEGRNAIWLAGRGWQVTGVDFSAAGLDKARALAARANPPHPIRWVCADVLDYRPDQPVDLVLMSYLQVVAAQRRTVARGAAAALAPGGILLVVAHDSANITEGTGGPQDPDVLYTGAEVADDLAGTGLDIDRAEAVERPVEGAPRPAIDVLFRAHRPR
jgi:SAM-dependent methyltransferase